MRLFVGIPLPSATRAALVAACGAVRAEDSRWRDQKWVAAESLHITLAFLGQLPDETAAPLSAAIGAELGEVHAFELPFARLTPVPNARRAGMLWASYADPVGWGAALASAIERAAASFGVESETRPFKAHVTLVRARRPLHMTDESLAILSAAQSGVPGFVSVQSATLFSSTLTRAGPHYEALATWEIPA